MLILIERQKIGKITICGEEKLFNVYFFVLFYYEYEKRAFMLSSISSYFPQNCFLSLMCAIGRKRILRISIITSSFR